MNANSIAVIYRDVEATIIILALRMLLQDPYYLKNSLVFEDYNNFVKASLAYLQIFSFLIAAASGKCKHTWITQ